MKPADEKRERSTAIYKQVFSSLSTASLALLGCHLYAEREMEHALSTLLTDPDAVIGAEPSFAMKVRILASVWPEPHGFDKLNEVLACLNKARNALAHGASSRRVESALEVLFRLFRDVDPFPADTSERLHYVGGYIAGYLSTADLRDNIRIKKSAQSLPRLSRLTKQLDQVTGRAASSN